MLKRLLCNNGVNIKKVGAMLVLSVLLALLGGCAEDRALLKKKEAKAKEELGISLVRDGQRRAGLKRLLEAAQLDPENPDIHHETALVYRDLGEHERSLQEFHKALALRPDFPEARNNLGTLYLLLKKWDLAIGCFKTAINNVTYETPHFAYNNLGLAYYNQGNYKEALMNYRKALNADPSFGLAYYNLGRVYEAMTKWDEAVDAYKNAISLYSGDVPAHFKLGKLYLKLDRRKEAAHELRRAADLDPDGPLGKEAKALIQHYQLE